MWLRDFLPSAIPEARIMTYGYDSIVAFDGSASRILDPARDLMEKLRAKRKRDEKEVRLLSLPRRKLQAQWVLFYVAALTSKTCSTPLYLFAIASVASF
jgi:hypothetical protein